MQAKACLHRDGNDNTGWGSTSQMRRRTFIQSAGAMAAAASLATPRLSLAADSKVLRFIPQSNLANLDPIWTTLYVVRNASVLFIDTLYGVDSNLVPKPQMCEGSEVSS